jgi:hypothetical protein
MAITSIERLETGYWKYTLDTTASQVVYVDGVPYSADSTSPITIPLNSTSEPQVEFRTKSVSPYTNGKPIPSLILRDYAEICFRGIPEVGGYLIMEKVDDEWIQRANITENGRGYYNWISEKKSTTGAYLYRIDVYIGSSVSTGDEMNVQVFVFPVKPKVVISFETPDQMVITEDTSTGIGDS